MQSIENRTFAELKLGDTAILARTLTYKDMEPFAALSGDADPSHVDDDLLRSEAFHGMVAHGMWGGALFATLLATDLPGPGTVYVSQSLRFLRQVRLGDTITVSVTVTSKIEETHAVVLECRATNQRGEEAVGGSVEVLAPTEKIRRPRVARAEAAPSRKGRRYERLIAMTHGVAPIRVAVVHPVDAASLLGAIVAARENLIIPVLVGPERKILAAAAQARLDLTPYEIVATEHSEAAAEVAVAMAHGGKVEALMKGALHTDELMRVVVNGERGLRTARRISHVFAIDAPKYPKALFVTDAAINVYPTLTDKRDIIQNAIDLAHALGIPEPRVAILSAVETVTEAIRSTLDAAALCKMADRRQITGGILDGPLAFDNAVSVEAAKTKGIVSSVAGPRRHLRRARSRGGKHVGETARISRRRRDRRHRARRARPDHSDQPRRQDAGEARFLRDRAAARPPQDGDRLVIDAILVLNSGSSSLKFSLFPASEMPTREKALCKGQCAGIGRKTRLTANDGAGQLLIDEELDQDPTHEQALGAILDWQTRRFPDVRLIAAAHRVVHGGPALRGTGSDRRGGARGTATAHSAGAAASAAPPRGDRGCFEAAPGPAADRLFRHRLPSFPIRGRDVLRFAASADGRRRETLRLSWALVRVYRQRPGKDHRPRDRRGTRRGRASRQRREPLRDPSRTQRRDDDGIHGARRTADEPQMRRARSGRRAVSHARKGHDGRRDQRSALPVVRAARRFGVQRRHEDAARERPAARPGGGGVVRLPHRSRDRIVGRRARRDRCAGVHRRDWRARPGNPAPGLRGRRRGSASRSTTRPTTRAGRGSRPSAAVRRLGPFQPTRI